MLNIYTLTHTYLCLLDVCAQLMCATCLSLVVLYQEICTFKLKKHKMAVHLKAYEKVHINFD